MMRFVCELAFFLFPLHVEVQHVQQCAAVQHLKTTSGLWLLLEELLLEADDLWHNTICSSVRAKLKSDSGWLVLRLELLRDFFRFFRLLWPQSCLVTLALCAAPQGAGKILQDSR